MDANLIVANIPLPTDEENYLAGTWTKDTHQLTKDLTALQRVSRESRAQQSWKLECLQRTMEEVLKRVGHLEDQNGELTARVADLVALLAPEVAA